MSDTSLGPTERPVYPPVANDPEVVGSDGVEVRPSGVDDHQGPSAAEHQGPSASEVAPGMIPGRVRRRTKLERASMRILATGGIVGVATALGAVLVGENIAGWIVGLAVGVTSVVLAAVLWSSRQL